MLTLSPHLSRHALSTLPDLVTLPTLEGLVRRRVLVNFRVDPAIVAGLLPAPFRPKLLADGSAMAGICLIRLEQLRPLGLPPSLGVASENAAHRIAVTWVDGTGEPREGVYIPRRDTGAALNAILGGRLFPGAHHQARFRVRDETDSLDLKLETDDGTADVWLRARPATHVPPTSHFASLDEASRFFAGGSAGYSPGLDPGHLDGLRLSTRAWRIEPLDVDWVVSSYYADRRRFPPGSVEYDCSLLMRDIPHEWQPIPAPCMLGNDYAAPRISYAQARF